jgi:hypothetical protein
LLRFKLFNDIVLSSLNLNNNFIYQKQVDDNSGKSLLKTGGRKFEVKTVSSTYPIRWLKPTAMNFLP